MLRRARPAAWGGAGGIHPRGRRLCVLRGLGPEGEAAGGAARSGVARPARAAARQQCRQHGRVGRDDVASQPLRARLAGGRPLAPPRCRGTRGQRGVVEPPAGGGRQPVRNRRGHRPRPACLRAEQAWVDARVAALARRERRERGPGREGLPPRGRLDADAAQAARRAPLPPARGLGRLAPPLPHAAAGRRNGPVGGALGRRPRRRRRGACVAERVLRRLPAGRRGGLAREQRPRGRAAVVALARRGGAGAGEARGG
mmetsp:Transcript_32537/g.104121  ORF Transcript_32537/g.104121 Transcript_32537/m.104121 type:complete len:257 (-) Transcript_32537:73-843(-)